METPNAVKQQQRDKGRQHLQMPQALLRVTWRLARLPEVVEINHCREHMDYSVKLYALLCLPNHTVLLI